MATDQIHNDFVDDGDITGERSERRVNSRLPSTDLPQPQVWPPPRPAKDDRKPLKGILRQPREKFPEDLQPPQVWSPPRPSTPRPATPRPAKDDRKPLKGILRQPREKFPDDLQPLRGGVARMKDAKENGIPPEARGTSSKPRKDSYHPSVKFAESRDRGPPPTTRGFDKIRQFDPDQYSIKSGYSQRYEGLSGESHFSETGDLDFEPVTESHHQTPTRSPADKGRDDDGISLADSAHSTMSVASIGSVFSLVSGVTGFSVSSLQGSQDVLERLVALFLEEETVRPICSKALEITTRERFERNLRRLLKDFAIALHEEAKSEELSYAARFVLHRARNYSHSICNTLQQTSEPKQSIAVEDETEEFLEDSTSDRSENFDSLLHLEDFIKGSKAMDALRKGLKEFVEQNTPVININSTKSSNDEEPEGSDRNSLVNLDDSETSPEKESEPEKEAEIVYLAVDNQHSRRVMLAMKKILVLVLLLFGIGSLLTSIL